MQFKLTESWSKKTRIFKQHNSFVTTIPSLLRRHLDLTKDDCLDFHWIYSDPNTIVVKIIRKQK